MTFRVALGSNRMNGAMRGVVAVILLVGPYTAPCATPTHVPEAPPLIVFGGHEGAGAPAPLSGEAAVSLAAIRSDPATRDVRLGSSDPASVLAAGALSLALTSTTDVVFNHFEVERHEDGLVGLYALDEAADTEISLVIQNSDVVGSVRRGNEVHQVQPLGDGLTAMYQVDTSQLSHHSNDWNEWALSTRLELARSAAPTGQAPETQVHDGPEAAPAPAPADSGDEIDILVVYTPGAKTFQRNMDSFVQLAIDNTNRIFGNSRMNVQVRAVHKQEIRYTQVSHMREDLQRLTHRRGHEDDPNGEMDEVHALRDRHGADLVVLVVARQSSGCGWGWIPDFWRYPDHDWADRGFSVIAAQNCETLTFHTFAHELGHNFGAAHDPDNAGYTAVSYGHGKCNSSENWNTIMSYGSNDSGSCQREIEYFSSPILRYPVTGTLTGDARVRDNRRALLETRIRVANFRASRTTLPTPQSNTHALPMVLPASDPAREGFVRVTNRSNRSGNVQITAFDDNGRRFGPVSLSVGPGSTAGFNSSDLEGGNSDKGLPRGVGNGTGNWRLELSTDLDIEALAYVRTADGFVTSMYETASETQESSNRYSVPFLNPGRNRNQRSVLRLINPGNSSASVEISGIDDDGRGAPFGSARLSLSAGRSRHLSAWDLENGGSGISGRLGAGEGKWRLLVSSNRPIEVMSLLTLPTGHITNLSRGLEDESGTTPPPSGQQPDLVVESASASSGTVNAGQAFTLRATVRNRGSGQAAATRLRFYRSSNDTISTQDTELRSVSVSALAPSAARTHSAVVNAHTIGGTDYYGACADTVPGETSRSNNCSSAVRVRAVNSGSRVGAIAYARGGQSCADGYGWGFRINAPDRDTARNDAVSGCRSLGLTECRLIVWFTQCGAFATGTSGSDCGTGVGWGPRRAVAESRALANCRDEFPSCRIAESDSGNRGSYCNAGFGASLPEDGQSGGGAADLVLPAPESPG